MSFTCYACRQPVSGLATRCPHCTSAINMGGGRDDSQDYAHLPKVHFTREQQDEIYATAFGWWIKFVLMVAIVWYFWGSWSTIFQWPVDAYMWIKSIFYSMLVWLFG